MSTLVQDSSAIMESDKIESPRSKETTDGKVESGLKEESEKVEVGRSVIFSTILKGDPAFTNRKLLTEKLIHIRRSSPPGPSTPRSCPPR